MHVIKLNLVFKKLGIKFSLSAESNHYFLCNYRACNPPTDPGRKPLSLRFLRHVPVIYVDHPGPASLKQIYGTFNRAMLRMVPSLRPYAEPLTNAMVDFYTMSQERFTQV